MSARLPKVQGEWIDRGRTIAFEFEGQRFAGFLGDTPSSALWAQGVRILGRSFKYHRPRGVLSMANHDINALMQSGAQLNLRADIEPLIDGMKLEAVNTHGGLARDRARWLDRLSAFFPVGFYYKAFHRPKSMANTFERVFRGLTGLGKLDFTAPHLRTPKRYDFTDVLVVGTGPSGLSAAIAAAKAGARVVVVDENAQVGGTLGYQRGGSEESMEILRRLQGEISQLGNISVRAGTLAAGWYTDHWVPLVDVRCMTKLRARAVVMATGAFEQPAVFRNNDLPGVMLASAAQRLIYRYGVKPMEKAVVLSANADGYRAALDLTAVGVSVAAVVDLRAEGEPTELAHRVKQVGIQVLRGSCIFEAAALADRLVSVTVCPWDAQGKPNTAQPQKIACDGVAMSVGWAPAAPMLYQAGTKMRYARNVEQFVPDRLADGMFAAGRVNGVYTLSAKLKDGERAGLEAAKYLGFSPNAVVGSNPGTSRDAGSISVESEKHSPTHPYPIVDHPSGKNFVDFDEDLQLKDFFNAAQEGFDNIELMKRYSTVGMGPSQGKHSNMNAIRILARIRGESPDQVGTTTARPFFHPVPFSHLAGRGFTPHRETPLHSRHVGLGAVWMQAGIWLRPEYYDVPGKRKAEIVRDEARAVRESIGIIDVGTLGKMELVGPDAGQFLERIYTGKFTNMKPGTTRYGAMLDESGVVIDDGVVAKLSDEHYYFTTTTTGSALIYRELQRLNTMWNLRIGIVNATGAFGAVNLAGPQSRRVLSTVSNMDLSNEAFPYLAARVGEVAGVPARLMRVGFVGELGYEIHVPADLIAHVWDNLMDAGASFGIKPFGVETQRLLRLEKGHIIIGQDTDGLTTPDEAGLGWAVKMDKLFFVGKRSIEIVRKRALRQKLVGFELDAEFAHNAPKECHLVIRDGNIVGRVTSIARSDAVGKHVGLAYVAPDMTDVGTRFFIRGDGGVMAQAQVVTLPFYDAAGERQKVQ